MACSPSFNHPGRPPDSLRLVQNNENRFPLAPAWVSHSNILTKHQIFYTVLSGEVLHRRVVCACTTLVLSITRIPYGGLAQVYWTYFKAEAPIACAAFLVQIKGAGHSPSMHEHCDREDYTARLNAR